MGERRLVTLVGCVAAPEQSYAMEKAVWLVDDVMGVINLLMAGTQGESRYRVARALKPSPWQTAAPDSAQFFRLQ